MKIIEVICPAYNEAGGIRKFYLELKNELEKLNSSNYSWRILFVHDSGNDNTWEIITEISSNERRVSGISMWRRFGSQAALWAGLKASTGDIIITMDSDGQHPPSLIAELVEEYEKGFPLVLTKRVEGFRIQIVLFYWLMKFFSQYPSVQSHSDYRLLSRDVVDILIEQFKESKPFLRVLMGYWGNVPVIKFKARKRLEGKSSYNWLRSYDLLIDVMLAAGHFPFRYFFPFLFLPTFVLSFYFTWNLKYFEAALFFLMGVFGFVIGLIGLQQETIVNQTRTRPAYLIRARINCK